MVPGRPAQPIGDALATKDEVDGRKVWAHWVWAKYGLDFLKQDGEWRIWHFRCYEVARAPFNRDWISFAGDNQHSHDSQLAWFGDDGKPAGRARDAHFGACS